MDHYGRACGSRRGNARTRDSRRGTRAGPRDRTGFTLVEVIVVVVIAGVIASIAAAPFSRMRTSAAVQSGRAQVTSALSLAQATAVRWGRTTTLSIDTASETLSIRIDTARTSSAPIVLRRYDLRELGVQLSSNRTALCYSSRGVGTTATGCPATGAQLIVSTRGRADTISINSAGRVWR